MTTPDTLYWVLIGLGGAVVTAVGARLGYVLYEEHKLEQSMRAEKRIAGYLENERVNLEQDLADKIAENARLDASIEKLTQEAKKELEKADKLDALKTVIDTVNGQKTSDNKNTANNNNIKEILDQNSSTPKNYYTFSVFGHSSTEKSTIEKSDQLTDNRETININTARLEETFGERVSSQSLLETAEQTIIQQGQILEDVAALEAQLTQSLSKRTM